jgi:hypothetical protein
MPAFQTATSGKSLRQSKSGVSESAGLAIVRFGDDTGSGTLGLDSSAHLFKAACDYRVTATAMKKAIPVAGRVVGYGRARSLHGLDKNGVWLIQGSCKVRE